MRQLTTLSLFLFLLLNLCSNNTFAKEKNPTSFEKESMTFNNLFLVLDPMEPTCMACQDGAVVAMAAGGVAPYTYLWSTGATTDTIMDLSTGTYTLTITDLFGCSAVDSVALMFNSGSTNLTLDVFTLATTCFGSSDGNAVAVANGGMMPYNYAWSTGDSISTASNLIAGLYTVTVTDAANTVLIDTFEIIEPTQLSATAATIFGCTGANSGEAVVTVSGGVFPYSFAWSTGDSTEMITGLSTGTYGITVTDANGCTSSASDILQQPIEINVNPEPTAPSCYTNSDGLINASTWGGTSPYTFAWSDGQTTQMATNLITGVYTVTITDALGCTGLGEVFLDAGNPLDIAVQGITTVSCVGESDGALLVDAFGGSGTGYTFLWDNGDTGGFADSLTSGFHLVTVTDGNQCSHVDSVFVNSPLALNSYTFSSPVCSGSSDGMVEVVPSGGTLPYTFSWSTGATTQTVTGLPEGNYFVTLTDINGCTTTDSIQVTVNTNGFASTVMSTNISCANGTDGTASIQPLGGVAPYTFTWSTGATDSLVTGLSGGTYTVTVVDAFGCSLVETATVNPPSPILANETIVDISCSGGTTGSISIDPSGGTGPYTIFWFDGSTGTSVNGLDTGNYIVDIIDANQCFRQFSFTISGNGDNPPTVVTQDITISLTPNNVATITANDVDGGTSDDCGLEVITVDISSFDCSQVGTQTVTLTAMDISGQTSTGTAMVTVQDTTLPTVTTQDITVSLDANGMASIATTDIDNGSSDNCEINTMALDIGEFNCSHLGANTVILTVSDQSGNIETGTAMVTVVDDLAPTIVTNNTTVYLNAQGFAAIIATDIADVTDNCGIDSVALGLDQFDCSNLGMNLVSVEIFDAAGNSSAGSALITVVDSIPPVIMCPQLLTAFACDIGAVVTYDDPLVIGLCDSLGMATLTSGMPSGSTFPVGTTTNVYSYTDQNGNTITCSFDVTIFEGTIDIMLDSITQPTPGNDDGAIDITVTGANPLTYEWFLNGTVISTDEDPTGLDGGIYEVVVTDVNGCTETLTVDFMTAINDPEIVRNINIYPNPTSEMLFVNIDLSIQEKTNIQLFNLDGKLMLENNSSASQNNIELNVSDFPSGIYILKLTVNDEIVTKRVTVSR